MYQPSVSLKSQYDMSDLVLPVAAMQMITAVAILFRPATFATVSHSKKYKRFPR